MLWEGGEGGGGGDCDGCRKGEGHFNFATAILQIELLVVMAIL